MNDLEKILEEIQMRANAQFARYTKPLIAVEDVEKIIRKHMDYNRGTFAFDFSKTDSFDCPCGRHYKHIDVPPRIVFCPECEVKVENDETDLCPECRKKLYEYEKKYNCIVDIGVNGPPGAAGYPGELLVK